MSNIPQIGEIWKYDSKDGDYGEVAHYLILSEPDFVSPNAISFWFIELETGLREQTELFNIHNLYWSKVA